MKKLANNDYVSYDSMIIVYYCFNINKHRIIELSNDPKIKNFLKKKRRDTLMPSFEDLGLMAFSKDKEYPIISNDNDLTFFADELYQKKLTHLIYNFNNLDIYNN